MTDWIITNLDILPKISKEIRNTYFLKGNIILLNGEIGSGKTTFLKATLKEYHVSSPSFLHALYYGEDFIHVDAYNLNKESLLNLNLEEMIKDRCIMIEWGNLVKGFLENISSNIHLIEFKLEENFHFLRVVY